MYVRMKHISRINFDPCSLMVKFVSGRGVDRIEVKTGDHNDIWYDTL